MSRQSKAQKNPGAIALNPLEIDTIGEILNISMGAAATAISLMLSKQVTITTPSVRVIPSKEFECKHLEPALGIEIEYIKGISGSNIMVMSRRDAVAIVGVLLGEDGTGGLDDAEMDEIRVSALGEIMNQMMGASCTALATFLDRGLNISPPKPFEINGDIDHFAWVKNEETIVTVGFRFVVDGLLDSNFVTIMPVDFAKELIGNVMPEAGDDAGEMVAATLQDGENDAAMLGHTQVPGPIDVNDYQESASRAPRKDPTPAPEPKPAPQSAPQPAPQPQMYAQPQYAQPAPQPQKYAQPQNAQPAPQPQMYAQQPMYAQPQQPAYAHSAPRRGVDVKPITFGSLDEGGAGSADQVSIDLVMDIDLNVVVEIGRIKKRVKEIVDLRAGSIIELDKQAGDPVDIVVNGKLIARGDVVVIDDNFGVRVTEIVASFSR
ncbi:MAG: flagellar motor switch protein FliN [Eubacteriales bacterium]|nr:flagellar motor switch protein FliN [Eubacteriales bacterium]